MYEAATDKDILAKLIETGVDLVITDLTFNEQESLERVEVLRDKYPELKIIALADYVGQEPLREKQLSSAISIVLKPVTPRALLQRIEQAFRQR